MNIAIEEYLKSFENLERYVLGVAPNTKPRMTQRDRWAKRPCVEKYHAFKDSLRLELHKVGLKNLPGLISFVIFYVPIPKTIDINGKRKSTKKMDLEDKPVVVRPDIDNYLKALFDSIESEDNFIHTVGVAKRYSKNPRIELYLSHEKYI